jgi:hypothetical protein
LVVEHVQKSRDFLYSQPHNNYLYQQHYIQTIAETDYYTNFRAASERVLLRLIGSSSTNGIAIYRSTNSEKT